MPAVIVQIKQWINYSGWMFLWCVAFPVFSVRDGGNQPYGVSLPAKDEQELLFHEQAVGDEGLHSTGSGGLAIVVNKRTRIISRSFMAQQGKGSRPPGARQSTLSFSGTPML